MSKDTKRVIALLILLIALTMLSSCKISKEKSNDRCLTDAPVTFKIGQDFSQFDNKTLKDARKVNSNYCCACPSNPICQKPDIINHCKRISK